MEKDNKVLWLTLILIFMGMFLIASVFASEKDETAISQRPVSYEVIQNYKNHNYGGIVLQTKPIQTNYINKMECERCDTSRRYYYYERDKRNFDNSIHYTKHSTESTKKGFLGDYVKEYSVDVRNTGKTGRYFTVKFNFEDMYGFEFSQAVTKYLRTGESKRFVYKDIQYERNEILYWDYTIIPEK